MFLAPTLRHGYMQDNVKSAVNGVENELARWLGRAIEPGFSTLSEKDGVWEISLDVPGVGREQLSIDIDGKRVRVQTKDDAPANITAHLPCPQKLTLPHRRLNLKTVYSHLPVKLKKKQAHNW